MSKQNDMMDSLNDKLVKKKSIDLELSYMSFEKIVMNNFQMIRQALHTQHEEIQQLKLAINSKEIIQFDNNDKQSITNHLTQNNGSQNIPSNKNDKQMTVQAYKIDSIIHQQNNKQSLKDGIIPIQIKNGLNNEIGQRQNPTAPQIEVIKQEQKNQLKQKQLEQQTLKQSQITIEIPNQQILQSKIFQMFERIRVLQEKQIINSRQTLKNFNNIEYSVQDTIEKFQKYRKTQKYFEDEVQRLRNELSEYKLRKQSQLMKALHSTNLNQSQNGNSDSLDYFAQKLQFLLKHIKQLVPKKIFEDDQYQKSNQIQNLRNKINNTISQNQLEQSLKNRQLKIYENIIKYLKSKKHKNIEENRNANDSLEHQQNILDDLIDKGNEQLLKKVRQNENKLIQFKEGYEIWKVQIENCKKKINIVQQDILQSQKLSTQNKNTLQFRINQIQKYLTDMKENYSVKHNEIQSQIVDTQENIQKLQNQLKFYTFTNKQSNGNIKTGVFNSQESLQDQVSLEKQVNSQIEAQVLLLKKKINKMIIKIQNSKQEIDTLRDDIMREFDGIKNNIDKKADWQSLKKGLNYFEEKNRENKILIKQIIEQFEKNDKQQSLAVKKGWTCLMCDKDIKNYEGKLSEVKFTSVFPARESPRIGGYYKQHQNDKQYKQLYLNSSLQQPKNNRRVSSLKGRQSKEDILI